MQSLGDSQELANFLKRATPKTRPDRISLAVLVGTKRFFASLSSDAVTYAGDELFSVGCLMQAFTATLATQVLTIERGWDDCVSRALEVSSPSTAARLEGIRLRHLLSHTHGLDSSLLAALPRHGDGYIDKETLCNALAGIEPLASPGYIYSYGNAGYWIAAALVEGFTHQRFHELLLERMITPLGLSSVCGLDKNACPAAGNQVMMSLDDALTFLQLHVHSDISSTDDPFRSFDNLASMRSTPVPLPGWAPAERASCQGWKSFGSGWFGHSVVSDDCSAFIRFSATKQTAIVLAADSPQLFPVFARLFSRVLPEFTGFRLPKSLSREESEEVNLSQYEGTYITGALTLKIVCREKRLRCEISTRACQADGSLHDSVSLRAAHENVFFPEESCRADLPFVQFIMPSQEGGYKFVWNGKGVWRRL